jgi:hypothetical protein
LLDLDDLLGDDIEEEEDYICGVDTTYYLCPKCNRFTLEKGFCGLFGDNSMDQKPTYEELERKLKIIADYTHSWEYWIGPDSKLQYVSPSCRNHTGYTQQEFIENENLF